MVSWCWISANAAKSRHRQTLSSRKSNLNVPFNSCFNELFVKKFYETSCLKMHQVDVNLRKVRYNYIEHCTFLTYFVQTDNKYQVRRKFNFNVPLKSCFNELFCEKVHQVEGN